MERMKLVLQVTQTELEAMNVNREQLREAVMENFYLVDHEVEIEVTNNGPQSIVQKTENSK